MPYFSVSGTVIEKAGVVIPSVSATSTRVTSSSSDAEKAAAKAAAVAKTKAKKASGQVYDPSKGKAASGGSSGIMKYLPWAAGALGLLVVVKIATSGSKKTESSAAA